MPVFPARKNGVIFCQEKQMLFSANSDTYPMMGNGRKNLCLRPARMYELQTIDNKVNFIECYESSEIPRLFGLPYPKIAANALTSIAKAKTWKINDCPVVGVIYFITNLSVFLKTGLLPLYPSNE